MLAAVLGLVAALAPAAATAGAATLSSTPDDTYITNGTVNAVARTASTIYLGGSFSEVYPRTGPLAAVSASTGALTGSLPEVTGGSIDAIISDGNGGYFIGGSFNRVGGVAIYGLAHILAGGALDTTWNAGVASDVTIDSLGLEAGTLYVGISGAASQDYTGDLGNGTVTRYYMAALNAANAQVTQWAPTLNGNVYSILVTPSSIYIGGNFSAANGAIRAYLAALDPTVDSGATQTLAWNPEVSDGVSASPLAISGSTVYIAGIFYDVGGVSRMGIAAVDATSGALDTSWDPEPVNGFVSAVAVSGSNVYLGGGFTGLGGQTRSYAGEVTGATSSTSVAALLQWNPDLASAVSDIAVSGSTVYIGGEFSGADDIGGSATRNYLAAVDATTGAPTSWDPEPSGNVDAIFPTGDTVTIAGGFAGVNGVARSNAAALDAGTGALTGWNPDVNAPVYALIADGSEVYLGGDFNGAGSVNAGSQVIRDGLAAVDSTSGQLVLNFNPQEIPMVDALLLSGNTLYVGGQFSGVIGQGVYRAYLAAVDAGTGNVTAWNPPSPDEFVTALALSGTSLYVGGNFTAVGASTRNYAAAFDTGSGALLPWNPSPDSIVRTLVVSGSTVYLGGYFANVDATPRAGVAAVDATDGALQNWNPALTQTSGAPNVDAIAVDGSDVYIGGDFDAVQGAPHVHVAQVSASTGAATAWNPDPTPDLFDWPVDAIATDGNGGIVIGGQFTDMADANQAYVASFSTAPSNTTAPSVSGTPAAGTTITCEPGSWSGSVPQTDTFQWLRDGTAITGATGSSYTVALGDIGHVLSCSVTASNLGGAVTATSTAVKALAPPVPVNVRIPVISGHASPGSRLTCSTGTWTNDPASYRYTWQRADRAIPGATARTYSVGIADEATGPADALTCAVVAHNDGGDSRAAVSHGVLVAVAGTLRCPRPTGALRGATLGPLHVGMARDAARRTLRRYAVTRNAFDNFCLYAGWGIRAGYAGGRIVLALTANPFYALGGVRPGTSARSAVSRLRLGRPIAIGRNRWYIKAGSAGAGVLKVQHGIVQEIGVASPSRTAGRRAEIRLLKGFPNV